MPVFNPAAGLLAAGSQMGNGAAIGDIEAPLLQKHGPGSAYSSCVSSDGAVMGDSEGDLARLAPIQHLRQFKQSASQLECILGQSSIGPKRQREAMVDYYHRQNELIDSLMGTEQIHRGQDVPDEEDTGMELMLHLSFFANCVLLAVRVLIATVAGSLSLFVALLDAVLDVISSAMLYWTTWQAAKGPSVAYPTGRERLEPLGVIVFSTIMGTAAFSVVMESIKALLEHTPSDLPMAGVVIWGTVGVCIMKFGLFLMCRGSRSLAVQAFALDHINDVVVNGVGLAGALLGARVASYWDPIVAILLSIWVVWAWGGQAAEHIYRLVGVSAPPELLQKLTFLTFYHDDRVKYIDTVRAYSFGHRYIAEIDIVLPEDMPLREAHDIGESLQTKLERMPEVARAFVHVDYETCHEPEHRRTAPSAGAD